MQAAHRLRAIHGQGFGEAIDLPDDLQRHPNPENGVGTGGGAPAFSPTFRHEFMFNRNWAKPRYP
jgi:hypothetical protein